VGTIGGPGDGAGKFDIPAGLVVDAAGNLFVADLGNHRIQQFAPTALDANQYDFVTAWGAAGAGNGQFNQPIDLAVDDNGTVFVVDFANVRIQVFAPVES
jgi:DNA-binding beta-propeller fold protein YncE